MAHTKALDILKEDHQRILTLLQEVSNLKDRDEKQQKEVFKELRSIVTTHSKMEEEILYPALRDNAATHDMGVESTEEHNAVKLLLGQLSLLPVGSDKWEGKFAVLKENLEMHIEEEENEVWPLFEKNNPAAELQRIGESMRQWKEEHQE